MRFWTLEAFQAAFFSVASMALLVLVAAWICGRVRALSGMPRALVAGAFGLVLGPPLLDLLPVSRLGLETLVYHGLGLVFAAVALRKPAPKEKTSHDARIIAASLPGLASIQGLVGVGVVAAMLLLGSEVHIGFGLLLPLGFNQGPGQALSMGEAWEPLGLEDGGAIGLIIASLGFAWCAIGGLYFTGLTPRPRDAQGEVKSELSTATRLLMAGTGGWSRLLWASIALGFVYALTYLALWLAGGLMAKPESVAMLYGFHFMIALSLGVGVRPLLARFERPADDSALALMSGSMVDVTTTAALSAISLAVFTRWLGPVLVLTGIGGIVTFLVCRWLQPKFQHHGLEHALLIFGIATGTFLTGMALLRAIDPDYSSTAGRNAVVAAGAEVVFAAPLLLLVLPYAVSSYADSPWISLATTGGLLAIHAALMVLAGVRLTRAWRESPTAKP
jgi:ESS family glutamate:Na+ symporter